MKIERLIYMGNDFCSFILVVGTMAILYENKQVTNDELPV